MTTHPSLPDAGAAHAEPPAQPSAPSPHDLVCLLYERSLVPVREIARLAGVTERNVYALVRRRGCRPRLRIGPGGGRRAFSLEDAPCELDAAEAERAIAACAAARARLHAAAEAQAQERERRAVLRQARKETEAEARALLLLCRALRDLDAAAAPDRAARKNKPRQGPKRRKEWRPMLVSPLPSPSRGSG